MTESERTNGVDITLNWDNRDFFTNPSAGQSLKLRWSRDFGWFDSMSSWTTVAGELDQYFSLGASDWFRQRVIALDVWTANSPRWAYRADGTIVHRPPTYAGATLGGWWMMRGYRIGRFSDKAAIYYAAEYRMIPKWNPFENWRWLQDRVGVQWIQLVPFAELGRVARSWDLGVLHSAMKWDLGFGFRFLARRTLVRIDVGGSREGAAVQMMVEQPFQY
jgi:outer membrane protein assembly factor BamA